MSSFTKGTHSQIHQQGARKKKSIQPFYCKFQPAIIPADLTAARPWKAASTPTNWQGHSHLFIYIYFLFLICAKSQGTVRWTAGARGWQRSCEVSLPLMSQREARWKTEMWNAGGRWEKRNCKMVQGRDVFFNVDGKSCAIRIYLQAGLSVAHPPCLRLWGCRSDEPQDLDGFLSICKREGERKRGRREPGGMSRWK